MTCFLPLAELALRAAAGFLRGPLDADALDVDFDPALALAAAFDPALAFGSALAAAFDPVLAFDPALAFGSAFCGLPSLH